MPHSNPLSRKQALRGWLGLAVAGSLALLGWLGVTIGETRGEEILATLALYAVAAILGLGAYCVHLMFQRDELRHALEEQQTEHQELFSALNSIADGILITDRQATITYANEAYSKLCGLSTDVLIGASTQVLNSEEALGEVYEDLHSALRAGEAWAGRVYHQRLVGTDQSAGRWSYLHTAPLGHGDGAHLAGFIGTQRDITAEVHAEGEAELLQEFASVVDRVGERLEESGGMEESLKSALSELTYGTGFREDLGAAVIRMSEREGAAPLVLASCGGFDRFESANSLDLEQSLNPAEPCNYQVFIGLSDDLLPAEELAGYVLVPFGETGDSRGLLVVGCEGRVAGNAMFADVLETLAGLIGRHTLQAQARTALEESVATTRHSNQLKTRFLAKMSQEIRTPMTSIVGYSDLLLDGERSAEDHEHASKMIRDGARELLDLVDGIIDISNMESGSLELDCTNVCPLDVLSNVVQGLDPVARAKGIRLDLVVESEVPKGIHSDPKRLRQVFTHLVGNAVKFTEVGSVTIRVNAFEEDGQGILGIDVIDTGIGILDDHRSQLFQAFHHGDGAIDRRNSGAGLGLALSRGLMRLLGGELLLDESERTGSTFSIELPLGDFEALDMTHWEDLHAGIVTGGAGLDPTVALPFHLLLAEDNPVNQRVISRLLQKAGAQVEIAPTGVEASKLVNAAIAANQPFDAVLMDLMMPEMDGLSATRQLRGEGHTLPIIALTADARIRTSIRCTEAGCNGFATKPVDREALFTLLADRVAENSSESKRSAG